MIIKVLGSAAGGGFPQWNCNGGLSRAAWNCDENVERRTQSSLAVSADGEDWVLLNASPDLRQQIICSPELHPRHSGALRNSPIRAVVLTNADVDHVTGLLTLRERQPFTIYAAQRVLDVLAANPIFGVLAPDVVKRASFVLDEPQPLVDHGRDLGLTVTAFAVPGKVALYLENKDAPGFGTSVGDTIGLEVRNRAGASFYYIPGCAMIDSALATRLRGARLVLFDGTLFTDDEMVLQGLSDKTGKRMGHISIGGEEGSLARLTTLGIQRGIYIHINNSNPVLDSRSAERRAVTEAGWDIAHDGMEVRL